MASEPTTESETTVLREAGDVLISLSGPSEEVARLQLAARWAERYASPQDDLRAMLDRFRQAYAYLEAVTHDLEPPGE
jgi:hypothetical protein